ncbi:MAG: outer membrane beta-barrel protein [Chitinophagaceae bacterium]
MKKILLSLVLVSVFIVADAQTDKGDWLVGGYFRLNTSKNNTQIALSPDAALFVIKNLAIGGNLTLAYSKGGDANSTLFSIGPYVRYYFTNANIRPILQGTVNFASQKLKISGLPSTTNNGTSYFLGGGAAIFISDQVSIDGVMGYEHSKFGGFSGGGGFALNVGFQVYLLRNQMDKLRGK